MAETYILQPIGWVRGGRAEAEDDNWDSETAEIILDADRFGPEALAGLEGFSHVEVVFMFDRLPESEVVTGARRPRGREDWPLVGVFAQRGRNRPNRLGVSVARLLSVEGLSVRVAGLDAIDGTPILDLKPVLNGFLPRGYVTEPDWAREIMKDYW